MNKIDLSLCEIEGIVFFNEFGAIMETNNEIYMCYHLKTKFHQNYEYPRILNCFSDWINKGRDEILPV